MEICDGGRYESTGWGKKRFAWHSGPEGWCALGRGVAGLKAGASSVAVLRRTCFAPGLRCVRGTGGGGGVDDSNSVLRGVLRGGSAGGNDLILGRGRSLLLAVG